MKNNSSDIENELQIIRNTKEIRISKKFSILRHRKRKIRVLKPEIKEPVILLYDDEIIINGCD
jgi:hypothetical protein